MTLSMLKCHSFAQRPALAHCDNVTNLDILEAGRQAPRHVLVVFLEAVVLSDVVEVVLVDDSSLPHLHVGHHTRQNLPLDRDITNKGAFLVNIQALSGLLGNLEAQTDIFVVSWDLLLASFSKQDPLI